MRLGISVGTEWNIIIQQKIFVPNYLLTYVNIHWYENRCMRMLMPMAQKVWMGAYVGNVFWQVEANS